MPANDDTSTPTGIRERRRHVRVNLGDNTIQVRMASLADFLDLYAYNISSGGMFIASDQLLDVGAYIVFCFELGGGERLEGSGQVTWIRESHGVRGPRGMGVRFVELQPDTAALVKKIVDRQRAHLTP